MILLFLLSLPSLISGGLITLQYYQDSSCYSGIFGVGVTSDTCIRYNQSSSVTINCTDSRLMITEYLTPDCTGAFNQSTITTTINSCGTTADFQSNNYYETPADNFRVICSDDSEWTTDGDYLLTRTTTVLQASSAVDFTQEICPENYLATPMEYCFLNNNADYCLPTDTDSDSGSSNSICLPAPVMYAYSAGCISPFSTLRSYQYLSNNRGLGNFYTYSDSACGLSDATYQLPYSECLGCNRFKDLKNNNDGGVGGVGLAVGMIVLIVVLVVVFVCCAGIACAACFIPAVAAFVLAIFCCRPRKSPEPTTMLPQTTNVAYPASNVAYPQTQYQTAYASDAYSTYGAPSLPPTYHGGSPSSPPSIEIISVQVPMDAKPGQVILVPKSNGQQIQVQLPPDVVPGGMIQVQG